MKNPQPTELNNSQQLDFLIRTFYDAIQKDDELGPIFMSSIHDWETHIELLCNFWESALFSRPKYKGNPLMAHIKLAQSFPLTTSLFERWLTLWNRVIDTHFYGEKALLAKERALRMAQVISTHTNQNHYQR